jgi:hypothetical protein
MLYVRVYHFGGDTKGFSEFSSHSQVANMYLKKTMYTKILLNACSVSTLNGKGNPLQKEFL